MQFIKKLHCCPAARKHQWTDCGQMVDSNLFISNCAWNPQISWGCELKSSDIVC